MDTESYEVEWCDNKGEWRVVPNGSGLSEAEAKQYLSRYKDWHLRILKCARTVVIDRPRPNSKCRQMEVA